MLIVILAIFLLLYLTRGYLKGLANDQTPHINVMPQEVLLGQISMPAAPNTLALQRACWLWMRRLALRFPIWPWRDRCHTGSGICRKGPSEKFIHLRNTIFLRMEYDIYYKVYHIISKAN